MPHRMTDAEIQTQINTALRAARQANEGVPLGPNLIATLQETLNETITYLIARQYMPPVVANVIHDYTRPETDPAHLYAVWYRQPLQADTVPEVQPRRSIALQTDADITTYLTPSIDMILERYRAVGIVLTMDIRTRIQSEINAEVARAITDGAIRLNTVVTLRDTPYDHRTGTLVWYVQSHEPIWGDRTLTSGRSDARSLYQQAIDQQARWTAEGTVEAVRNAIREDIIHSRRPDPSREELIAGCQAPIGCDVRGILTASELHERKANIAMRDQQEATNYRGYGDVRIETNVETGTMDVYLQPVRPLENITFGSSYTNFLTDEVGYRR